MTPFADLLRSPLLPESRNGFVGDWQKQLDALFPSAVAASPFRLWSPGDAIPSQGRRLLIGVATWSKQDLALLDTVAQAVLTGGVPLTIEVFNVAECRSPSAFEDYIPGLGRVFQTPVVGLWSDGQQTDAGSGKSGRELIGRLIGLDTVALSQ
jgi:hypothetical protein